MATVSNGNKLTAQQRAVLFGANTRQHWQMLGSKTGNEGDTLEFSIPKVRLLSGIKLLVEGDFGVTNTKNFTDDLMMYKILRAVRVDYNNGFAPITTSGYNLAHMNTLRSHAEKVFCGWGDTNYTVSGVSSWPLMDSAETATFRFMLDIPLTLNERDPVGMVLTQNAETNANISVDINSLRNVFHGSQTDDTDMTGGTLSNLRVTPMTVTYSIPANSDALPDLSVIRVVNSATETFSQGVNQIRMRTGMIYRKIMLRFTTENDTFFDASNLISPLELVFNTADTPYSVTPSMLREINIAQNGVVYPHTTYFWDFSFQGINNLGGSRDYIDTETLTSLELKFQSMAGGKVEIIAEQLSRLK